jgi:uncharacterized protein
MRRSRVLHQVVWRSAKPPGMECCFVAGEGDGWVVRGTLVRGFREGTAGVSYHISTDGLWRTTAVNVEQLFKGTLRKFEASAKDGNWFINGRERVSLKGCLDVDLGASPVTNTFPIKRTKLKIGSRVDLVAAWLSFPSLKMQPLKQSYERIGENRYVYRSATGFSSEILVDRFGLVRRYGNYWVAV